MGKRKKQSGGNKSWNWKAIAVFLAIGAVASVAEWLGEMWQKNPLPFIAVIVVAAAVIVIWKWIDYKKASLNAVESSTNSIKSTQPVTVEKADSHPNESIDEELARKRQELMMLDDELLYQSFGLYNPRYPFSTVDGFKDELDRVRQKQKQMIRDNIACQAPNDITYNNSLKEGAKIVNDWVKLMLRAFNGECDAIIIKAKFNNLDQLEKRIRRSAEEISKIGQRMRISIQPFYIQLKVDELHIAYEYEMFKHQEKERIRAIREEEREKAKVEKELAAARAKVEKDQKHIRTELDALNTRMQTAEQSELESLRRRIAELESNMLSLDEELENIDERSANARAGYVYVISNIGSFGEDVYKIGLTRRLDPQERVDELGDASVPFRFDVHAFIFSTDAVALETALHHRFDDRRINLVNHRKEFFRVSLEEIEREVKANHSEVVEFTRTAAAQEYRESVQMRREETAA